MSNLTLTLHLQANYRMHVAYKRYKIYIKIVRASVIRMQKLARNFIAFRRLSDLRIRYQLYT